MPMISTAPLHGGQLRQISERFNIPCAQLMDFSANINPDGPPASVLATLRAALDDVSTLTSYPDLEEMELKQSIADYAGVHPENLVVANGFIPLLESALRTLRIERCLLPVPAFVEYRLGLARVGIEIHPHVLAPASDFRYDTNAFLQGNHDAVLLANPQNPSGVLASREILLEFVFRCAERNIIVLLDEAFIDYAPFDSLTADVNRFPNLLVFRSVTKFHGIPGLRVAYAAANPTTARALNENLPPWPITTLASRAVAVALADRPFAERSRRHNERRRTRMKAALEVLDVSTYPSAANFLLLRLPHDVSAERLWRHMIADHYTVLRNCSNYEALPSGHLRVAVHTEEQNDKLVGAFAASLQLLGQDRWAKTKRGI